MHTVISDSSKSNLKNNEVGHDTIAESIEHISSNHRNCTINTTKVTTWTSHISTTTCDYGALQHTIYLVEDHEEEVEPGQKRVWQPNVLLVIGRRNPMFWLMPHTCARDSSNLAGSYNFSIVYGLAHMILEQQ